MLVPLPAAKATCRRYAAHAAGWSNDPDTTVLPGPISSAVRCLSSHVEPKSLLPCTPTDPVSWLALRPPVLSTQLIAISAASVASMAPPLTLPVTLLDVR